MSAKNAQRHPPEMMGSVRLSSSEPRSVCTYVSQFHASGIGIVIVIAKGMTEGTRGKKEGAERKGRQKKNKRNNNAPNASATPATSPATTPMSPSASHPPVCTRGSTDERAESGEGRAAPCAKDQERSAGRSGPMYA